MSRCDHPGAPEVFFTGEESSNLSTACFTIAVDGEEGDDMRPEHNVDRALKGVLSRDVPKIVPFVICNEHGWPSCPFDLLLLAIPSLCTFRGYSFTLQFLQSTGKVREKELLTTAR